MIDRGTVDGAQKMQCTSDLKATGIRFCLLHNFGEPHLWIKRAAHDL